jgi:hypothetical protein
VSIAGLKISTFCFAILALLRRRISSSVFPENIDPQITSIHPAREGMFFSMSIDSFGKLFTFMPQFATKVRKFRHVTPS